MILASLISISDLSCLDVFAHESFAASSPEIANFTSFESESGISP